MEQPYQHAIYYTNLILSERSWSNDELLAETESRNFELKKNQFEFDFFS